MTNGKNLLAMERTHLSRFPDKLSVKNSRTLSRATKLATPRRLSAAAVWRLIAE
jgi:hypothetical protein